MSGGGELGLTLARSMLAGSRQVPYDPLTLFLSCPFLAMCCREYPTDTPASAETWDIEYKGMSSVSLGSPQRRFFYYLALTTSRGMLRKPRETLRLVRGQAWVLLGDPGERLIYLLLPLKGSLTLLFLAPSGRTGSKPFLPSRLSKWLLRA